MASSAMQDEFEHEQILWGDEPDYGPPRCICGRFVSEWGIVHDECRARMVSEELAAIRQTVESQGLVLGGE